MLQVLTRMNLLLFFFTYYKLGAVTQPGTGHVTFLVTLQEFVNKSRSMLDF